MSAFLLAEGRAGMGEADVVAVTPEGFEDIDCVDRSGRRMLVQSKERGIGSRAIAQAELVDIICHAAPALVADPSARFVVVTNGSFGQQLPAPDRHLNILTGLESERRPTEGLVEAMRSALTDAQLSADPIDILRRTALHIAGDDLSEATSSLLSDAYELSPAAAAVIRAELLRDLGAVAAAQREARLETAVSRSLTELDALVVGVLQAVDLPSLEEAIEAGVCQPANFVGPPPIDASAFLAGVDVTPAHIAGNLDVIRVEETAEVIEGLDRAGDVVIVGPSGSGKSALLWRSAHLLREGARVVRVLRVADDNDVAMLVRHVLRQMPSRRARVVVAADDLGRDQMAAWAVARRRLGEIDGVLLLASVRREDVTPGLTGSAVIVDPRLTEASARAIYAAIEASMPSLSVDQAEAIELADGLLMEFIALVTTGQRLREVLASQLHSMRGELVALQTLRLICGAHLLGSATRADHLPLAVGVSPQEVGAAVARLAGEHLVVAQGHLWHGLHDLRTETLFSLLHESPPPSSAATYASALPLLPPGAQGPGARRAVVRVARRVAADTPDLAPAQRLTAIHRAIAPIATALSELIRAVIGSASGAGSLPAHVASLLEAADRLDTVAYVHSVLPLFERERERRPSLEMTQVALLAYTHAMGDVDFSDLIPAFGRLADRLPPRTNACGEAARCAVPGPALVRLLKQATLASAVRLCEAAENVGAALSTSEAVQVFDHHVQPNLSAGADQNLRSSDLRAQLTASLASVARLRGVAVAEAFGPAEDRSADAVASDAFGVSVRLMTEPADSNSPAPSMAREFTFSESEMLVAEVHAFARHGHDADVDSAYSRADDNDPTSINEQAVRLARRVLDACPEVDRADVRLIGADLEVVDGGEKHLRSGAVPRSITIQRNVAFHAGVSEAMGAGSWTRRLREQAAVAADLSALLRELPRRLELTDNARRRAQWAQDVRRAEADVAGLPTRPPDRLALLGAAEQSAIERPASLDDEELRRSDAARSVLATIASVLSQVATNLDDNLPGAAIAGFRLAETPLKLAEARNEGAPVLAKIGETLPEELDHLIPPLARRLLSNLG